MKFVLISNGWEKEILRDGSSMSVDELWSNIRQSLDRLKNDFVPSRQSPWNNKNSSFQQRSPCGISTAESKPAIDFFNHMGEGELWVAYIFGKFFINKGRTSVQEELPFFYFSSNFVESESLLLARSGATPSSSSSFAECTPIQICTAFGFFLEFKDILLLCSNDLLACRMRRFTEFLTLLYFDQYINWTQRTSTATNCIFL